MGRGLEVRRKGGARSENGVWRALRPLAAFRYVAHIVHSQRSVLSLWGKVDGLERD